MPRLMSVFISLCSVFVNRFFPHSKNTVANTRFTSRPVNADICDITLCADIANIEDATCFILTPRCHHFLDLTVGRCVDEFIINHGLCHS